MVVKPTSFRISTEEQELLDHIKVTMHLGNRTAALREAMDVMTWWLGSRREMTPDELYATQVLGLRCTDTGALFDENGATQWYCSSDIPHVKLLRPQADYASLLYLLTRLDDKQRQSFAALLKARTGTTGNDGMLSMLLKSTCGSLFDILMAILYAAT